MINRNGFYKKTRRGKVVRLIHEKYLRTDVGCGYVGGIQLSEDRLRGMVSESPHQQCLVIDTNIALHQIDLLEYKCSAISIVIVLQTVLQELRHLNISCFHRMQSLLKDEHRSFVFYPNELCAETSTQRTQDELVNDFNDRAIRKAAKYFNDLLAGVGKTILISNDKNNRVSKDNTFREI